MKTQNKASIKKAKATSSSTSSTNSTFKTAIMEMMKNSGAQDVKPTTPVAFLPVAERPLDSNKLLDKEKLNVEMSGWCKISSPNFKNQNMFPLVPLPDYSTEKIPLGHDYFRINDFFNPEKEGVEGFPPTNLDFWFRYSDKNLYFAGSQKSLHILGSLAIRSIVDIDSSPDDAPEKTCFRIKDSYDSNWMVCPLDLETKTRWICRMKLDLGIEEDGCKIALLSDTEATVITQKISQPIIMVPLPASDCNENWDYKKKGETWNCDCSEGKEQSPIDLPNNNRAIPSPVKPIFNYEEMTAKQTEDSFEGFLRENEFMKIYLENGAIKIKHPNMGKVVTLDGAIYLAQDVVFHSPSEHKVNGVSFDMEIQIIHYGQTKGDIAKQLILSFMITKAPGVYNKFFDDLDFFNLPSPANREREITKNLFIPRIFYNTNEKVYPLMKRFNFFTYQGSLTSPPCTERTIHIVAESPIQLSTTTVALFKEAIKMPDTIDEDGNMTLNTSAPENNRLVQPLNGRVVYYYDSFKYEGPEPPVKLKEKKDSGHYERMVKKFTSYFHVTGSTPSGLPNSFVVSQTEAKGNMP
jgi:carbonic anhydrase